MVEWYVKGQTGNDANSGLSPDLPKKTMIADSALTVGDIVNVAEKIRSSAGGASENVFTKNNITIRQWSEQTQAEFRGDLELAQTGWSASTNAWQLTITTGLTLDALAYKWDANVDANGRHYGHLVSDTLVNVQNATGAVGRYNYNSGTGLLTVYLGGDNPNTSGYPVAYITVSRASPYGGCAIVMSNNSGWTVSGINFALYTTENAAGQNGWAVLCERASNGTVTNCTARDMGGHGFGTLGAASACSNITFSGCVVKGARSSATDFIAHTDTQSLSGIYFLNCTAWTYRVLGTDGAARSGLAIEARYGFYAHANSGTPLADILGDGCTVRNFETAAAANGFYKDFDAANVPAPSDPTVFNAFAVRWDRCTSIDSAKHAYTVHMAFRRTKFRQTVQIEQGIGSHGSWVVAAADKVVYLEECELIVNIDDASGGTAQTRAFSTVTTGTTYFYMVNVSCWNAGTQSPAANFHGFCDYQDTNANFFRCYGCVFGHAVTGSASALCFNDAAVTAANHTFDDNRYYGIYDSGGTSRMSQNASFDAFSEWILLVDLHGGAAQLASAPWPNAPTDLGIDARSSLWPLRRATVTVIPTMGINFPQYLGYFGAYQYPATDIRTGKTRLIRRIRPRP